MYLIQKFITDSIEVLLYQIQKSRAHNARAYARGCALEGPHGRQMVGNGGQMKPPTTAGGYEHAEVKCGLNVRFLSDLVFPDPSLFVNLD